MEHRARQPLIATLIAALLLAGRTPAQGARTELFERMARRVEALADRCQSERLYLERDRLYESLLRLEPDHAEARRFLRYRRSASGWTRGNYNMPRNYADKALGELEAQRAELAQDWRQALVELRQQEEASEEVDAGRFWEEVLILAPDDAEARERRGEVRDPVAEEWILRESAVARARRAQLLAQAAEIRAREPEIEDDEPSVEEAFLDWTEVRLAPAARVLVATRKPEAEPIVRSFQAATGIFRVVFDEAPLLPGRLTLCVLEGSVRCRRFLAGHPDLEADRQLSFTAPEGFWIAKGSTLAVSGQNAEARADQALRQFLLRMLDESFGLGVDVQWAREGLVLRLAELVAGSDCALRQATLCAGGKRLRKGETLWSAARALGAREARPHLEDLVALAPEDYGREHLLLSYSLACYLLEGRPERLAQTLDALGREPGSPSATLERRLELDLERLDARLARWVHEMGE